MNWLGNLAIYYRDFGYSTGLIRLGRLESGIEKLAKARGDLTARGAKQEIRTGDVIWTPPGLKHWHGATAVDGMTHIAVQEHVDGKVVDWLEHVSDEQYGR